MIPDLGGKGQIRLRQARVLIIGAGGLGSPAALYLGAAGVGTLGLVDPDRVELSNLQRQILHTTLDLSHQKVESAKDKISKLNPDVEVVIYPVRLEEDNAATIFSGYDFIVDGSDNFPTKFLVNDIAVSMDIAFSHAGIVRLQGQTMTVVPRKSACYRCSSESRLLRRNIELPASRYTRSRCRDRGIDPGNRSDQVSCRL